MSRVARTKSPTADSCPLTNRVIDLIPLCQPGRRGQFTIAPACEGHAWQLFAAVEDFPDLRGLYEPFQFK
jgi:hypothetical protein